MSTVALASVDIQGSDGQDSNVQGAKDLFLKIMPTTFIHSTIIGNNFMDLTEVEFYR